jgi:hypothetical protein
MDNRPVVIQLFIFLFKFIAPIVKLIGYFVCLPQVILKYIKLEFIEKFDFKNFIQLTIHSVFYIVYIGIYLNFHFIYFYYHYGEERSFFRLFLAFWVIYSFTAIFYKIEDMRFFIFKDMGYLIYILSYELIWVIILICLILSFGRLPLIDFINFKQSFIFCLEGYYLLISFAAEAIFMSLGLIISHILILLHIINPLSLIRAIYLVIYEGHQNFLKTTIISTIFILVDFYLIFATLVNSIFIWKFIPSVYQVFLKIFTFGKFNNFRVEGYENTKLHYNGEKFSITNFEASISYAQYYIYTKNVFILKPFKDNLKILCGFIFFILSSLIFWKIPQNINNFGEYIQHYNLPLFAIKSLISIVDGLLEITSLISIIFNHISPINFVALYKLKKYYKESNTEYKPPFSILNIFIFINKGLDCIVTLISFLRILCFNFIVSIFRSENTKKNKFQIYFPLLYESELFLSNGFEYVNKCSPKNTSLEIFSGFLARRRINLLTNTFLSIYEMILLVLNLPSLLDPLNSLEYIKNFYFFYYECMYTQIKYKKIKNRLSIRNGSLLLALILDIVIILPINLLLSIIAPWCFFEFIFFIYKNSIKKPFEQMRLFDDENENSQPDTKINFNKRLDFLSENIKKFINGWTIIIQFVSIHLSIIRAYLMWKEFLFLKKAKNMVNQNKTKEVLVNKLSISSQDIVRNNDHSLFKQVMSKNFKLLLKEIIFYPFLISFFILTPWTLYRVDNFFSSYKFVTKFKRFLNLLKEFILDIFTMFSVILLILSVFNTFKILTLIFYSFKKNLIRSATSISDYEFYYKNDFRTEVKNISGEIFKKIIILLMIVFNIILITRIFSVFRRVKRFAMAELKKDFYQIKKLFMKKSPVNTHEHISHNLGIGATISIFQFLDPLSLKNLSMVNKNFNNKSSTKLIWKNLYENYYVPRLEYQVEKSLEITQLLAIKSFENYKEACKTASSLLGKKILISENRRDELIGLYYVMVEESIESLLKLPHLLLIPVKILSFVIWKITANTYKLYNWFLNTRICKNYLEDFFANLDALYSDLKEEDETLNFLVYNIQKIGLINLGLLCFLLLACIISTFFSVYTIFVKLISFRGIKLRALANIFDYQGKLNNFYNSNRLSGKISLLYQYCLGLCFIILHVLLALSPIIYNHHKKLHYLVEKNSSASFKISNSHFWFYLIEDIFNLFWQKNLFGKVQIIFGKYFINIFAIIINLIFLKCIHSFLKNTDIIIYDIVNFIIDPSGLLRVIFENVMANIGSLINILFPQIIILKIFYKAKLQNSELFSIILNIYILFIALYPFYLNFTISLTFFKFLILNCYAFTNIFKITKIKVIN